MERKVSIFLMISGAAIFLRNSLLINSGESNIRKEEGKNKLNRYELEALETSRWALRQEKFSRILGGGLFVVGFILFLFDF